MMRDPHINLIRIDNAPVGFQVRDSNYLERMINNHIREEKPDLAVRVYQEYNNFFVIIYLGSCQRLADVVEFLKAR